MGLPSSRDLVDEVTFLFREERPHRRGGIRLDLCRVFGARYRNRHAGMGQDEPQRHLTEGTVVTLEYPESLHPSDVLSVGLLRGPTVADVALGDFRFRIE